MKAYLEANEIGILAKAARCVRDMLLILLLFYLGCRISELLALEVKDIDFTNATVTIQHLKQRLKLACVICGARLGRSHTFCPGCGNEVAETTKKYEEQRRLRTLPINDDILNILREYIEKGGPVLKDGKLLIFGINRHRAWGIIKECAERAGLPRLVNPETGRLRHISPNRLRDAFAVRATKVAGGEHREWYQRLWDGDKL
jgi:integrase/recombinase XerD